MAATTVAGTVTTDVDQVEVSAGRLAREAARVRTAELFNTHHELIGRICRGLLRDPDDAEDAAQQAFLSAYRALLAGSEPRDPEAWLATIARNECLQRIKTRMRQPLPVVDVELADARGDVHQQAVERLRAERLWREIAHLPQHQRDAVVLRELAGLSYEDVAAALGTTTSAVESLLFRARGRLRARMRAVVAALDLGGLASGAAAAVARLLSTGGGPLAVKAAAVGVGVGVVGGGGLVSERVLVPDTHRADVVTASTSSAASVFRLRPAPTASSTFRPVVVQGSVSPPVVTVHVEHGREHEERPASTEDHHHGQVTVPAPLPAITRPTTHENEATVTAGGGGTTPDPVPPPVVPVPAPAAPAVVTETTKSGEDVGRGETTVSTESAATTITTSNSGDGGGHDGGHGGSTTTGETTTDGDSGGSGKGRR